MCSDMPLCVNMAIAVCVCLCFPSLQLLLVVCFISSRCFFFFCVLYILFLLFCWLRFPQIKKIGQFNVNILSTCFGRHRFAGRVDSQYENELIHEFSRSAMFFPYFLRFSVGNTNDSKIKDGHTSFLPLWIMKKEILTASETRILSAAHKKPEMYRIGVVRWTGWPHTNARRNRTEHMIACGFAGHFLFS